MAYFYEFASLYDEFTENVEYCYRANFLLKLLSKNGIKGGILLDLACGTGSMIPYFREAGYEVIGIDNSPDMLSVASEKTGNDKDVLLLCQDMRSLDLYGTIDCAVCSLDSVNHLLTEDDVSSAFRSVSLFLRPGGIFVFDVNTLYKHRFVLSGNSFVYENDEAFLVWQNSECDEDDTVDFMLDIFLQQEDGSYSRVSEDFSERAYSAELLTKLLDETGLEVVALLGDMTGEAPREEEERIYFVVRKR